MRIMHDRPDCFDLLRRILNWHVQRRHRGFSLRARPSNRIANHTLNLFAMVNRISLVPRAEIKNSTAAANPAVAPAKNLAALEPRNENLLIRRGDTERLAVHF